MARMTVKSECGAALWGVAAVGYLLLEAFSAAGFEPDYSYLHNYISDLGVSGPRAYLMHTAFYLQGVLFLLGALLIVPVPRTRSARVFLGLVAANAVGNIVVGTVHSGKAHVVGAALAIAGGNFAILVGSAVVGAVVGHRWYRGVSGLIAALGILCLSVLTVNSVAMTAQVSAAGAWERGSVYSITMWQLLTAAGLLVGAGRGRDRR
jgi:hypothetical membrane protein